MSESKKRLSRETQCSKCPWRKNVDPNTIPNGYCREKHKLLKSTIATDLRFGGELKVMACHEGDAEYCIGWLMNQLRPGNNIGIRLKMFSYDLSKVKLIGDQHKCFEDTIK